VELSDRTAQRMEMSGGGGECQKCELSGVENFWLVVLWGISAEEMFKGNVRNNIRGMSGFQCRITSLHM